MCTSCRYYDVKVLTPTFNHCAFIHLQLLLLLFLKAHYLRLGQLAWAAFCNLILYHPVNLSKIFVHVRTSTNYVGTSSGSL